MYNISQFAQKVGVAVKTLQRWDREGRLVAHRTLTNRRYYTNEDLAVALGLSTTKKALKDDQSAQDQASSDN
jgi:putative resolvase